MIGTIGIALIGAHYLGDFWVQQHHWSAYKAERSARGHLACGLHVATYTAVCWAAVYLAAAVDGLDLSHAAVAVGMAVNAATHYALDRRRPLVWLARVTGHGGWIDADPAGARMHLDQAAHLTVLAAVAILIAAMS